jgi:hypothetical protein
MKDYACERVYRDARITSIYEGTTQLQVVAAIRHVTTGTYLNYIREQEAKEVLAELENVKATLVAMTNQYEEAVKAVLAAENTKYVDFMARRLVEMAGHIVMSYLLLDDTMRNGEFERSLRNYVRFGKAEVAKHAEFIANFNVEQLDSYLY